jgi:hypothetical protein
MTGQELKAVTLDEKERVLCQNCQYRYCPTYECGLLDKANLLTDRQWNNIAKNVGNGDDLSDVPYEIWKRRVKHDQH